MKLEAGFDFKYSARRSMIETLLSLSGAAILTHERDGEDEPPRPIMNRAQFLDDCSNRSLGPILVGPNLECDISFGNGIDSTCSCELDMPAEEVKRFMLDMAAALPTFGYACSSSERVHRNRVYVKSGSDLCESWVGRDLHRYVPGLYWLTLLSEQLAEEHEVSLTVLEQSAKLRVDAPGGMHLFQFYDRPDDWREDVRVRGLVKSIPGIFDIDDARREVDGTASLLEFLSAAQGWK